MYSTVIQLYNFFFFQIICIIGCYKILSTVPCAIQQVFIGSLFLFTYLWLSGFCCSGQGLLFPGGTSAARGPHVAEHSAVALQARERRFSSCSAGLSCSTACGLFPGPEANPFLCMGRQIVNSGLPGKPRLPILYTGASIC